MRLRQKRTFGRGVDQSEEPTSHGFAGCRLKTVTVETGVVVDAWFDLLLQRNSLMCGYRTYLFVWGGFIVSRLMAVVVPRRNSSRRYNFTTRCLYFVERFITGMVYVPGAKRILCAAESLGFRGKRLRLERKLSWKFSTLVDRAEYRSPIEVCDSEKPRRSESGRWGTICSSVAEWWRVYRC